MNEIYEKNLHVIMGGTPQKHQQIQLTPDAKKKIQDAYFKMYYGLAFANWMRGMTLGAAWHQALGQVKTFVGTKNANNPAAMYLKQINAAHSVQAAKQIMTHPYKDAHVQCPPEHAAAVNKKIGEITNAGLGAINGCVAQYDAMQKQSKQANYADAQKKMQQMLQLQMQKIMMQQNQNVA